MPVFTMPGSSRRYVAGPPSSSTVAIAAIGPPEETATTVPSLARSASAAFARSVKPAYDSV